MCQVQLSLKIRDFSAKDFWSNNQLIEKINNKTLNLLMSDHYTWVQDDFTSGEEQDLFKTWSTTVQKCQQFTESDSLKYFSSEFFTFQSWFESESLLNQSDSLDLAAQPADPGPTLTRPAKNPESDGHLPMVGLWGRVRAEFAWPWWTWTAWQAWSWRGFPNPEAKIRDKFNKE